MDLTTQHTMKLNEIWFNYVKKGNKTIEGRLYDSKRKQLKVGDIIVFKNIDSDEPYNTIKKQITNLDFFDNFSVAINEHNYKEIIPNAENRSDALQIYNDIYKKVIENSINEDGVILIYF